ncbi:phosphotransferase, partial [Paenarthrobacter sp. RAF9]
MSKGTNNPAIESLLRTWLPTKRWFPVKSPDFAVEQVGGFRLPAAADDAAFEVVLLAVTYRTADGGPRTDVVQVPLSFRSQPLVDAPTALLGEFTDPERGLQLVYDAVYDSAFVSAWLDFMRSEASLEDSLAQGHLTHGKVTLPRNPVSARVLSGEQSNTSVIIDDGDSAAILKVFRVLAAGKNPEVELGAALTAAGTSEVPATLGWITGSWHQPASNGSATASGELTVAHEFLLGGQDAWRLAVDAAAAGKDFTAEARGLGAATATVHARLAETFGVLDGQSQGPDIIATVARRVRQSWAEAASAVGPYDANVQELLDTLDPRDVGQLQRVHGDLHLGQILWVPGADDRAGRWAILDFEGEPLRTIDERNMPDLPLRDVSGMLRSFDYAAGAATRENADASVPETWVDDCAAAFLEGYSDVTPGTIDRRSPLFVALWL